MIKKIQRKNYKDIRVIKNILGSLLIKGGGIIISLFTIPAYMRYFENNEVLGIWFTMLSMLSWILTFDLGIGNGLRNHLIKPIFDNDEKEIRKYISSSYIIIGLIVIITFIVGYFISSYINWNLVYNINEEIISKLEFLKIIRIIFFGILLQFLLKLNNSILYALQKSTIPNLLNLITNILMLLFVLNFKAYNLINKLNYIAIYYVFATNFPILIATIIIFSKKLKKSIPHIDYFSKTHTKKILKLGGEFFWLQIMQMIIFTTNEFLIVWLVNPSKVVEYQIYNKMFGLVVMIFQVALNPVWSEVTEAYKSNDFEWINRLYKRLERVVFMMIGLQIFILLIIQKLVNLWLRNESIPINIYYSLIFAIWSIIYMYVIVNATIVAGLEKLKIAIIFLTVGASLNFILSYIFVKIFGSWIAIILANIFSLIPFCIVQPYFLKKYLKSKLFNI